jgi:hypothetical protein
MTYECRKCGATNVKLWRPYCTFSIELKCANCLTNDPERPDLQNRYVDKNGRNKDELGASDSLGWWVPAVPVKDDPDAFWGYTSVPQDGVDWWRRLPTYGY